MTDRVIVKEIRLIRTQDAIEKTIGELSDDEKLIVLTRAIRDIVEPDPIFMPNQSIDSLSESKGDTT